MLQSEEWCGVLGLRTVSSEAETRLRGRQALERGGYSPEGAPGPRARRRLRGAAPSP
jgi:hypothetical protein